MGGGRAALPRSQSPAHRGRGIVGAETKRRVARPPAELRRRAHFFGRRYRSERRTSPGQEGEERFPSLAGRGGGAKSSGHAKRREGRIRRSSIADVRSGGHSIGVVPPDRTSAIEIGRAHV